MKTPLLFLVFNRPATTARVFAAIRAARPERLYVAADGPRPGRPGEADTCAEVRAIATAVDWPCEVVTLFRPANLGCKAAVSAAIDWFFAHEVEGLILEDDVLPDASFFPYCEELLARYRDDSGVSMISGCTFIGDRHDAGASYAFSHYMHIWGWASWRRAWQHYDVDMAAWPSPAARARLADVLGHRRPAIRYWSAIFDAMVAGAIDTWDYQWVFAAWMHGMVATMPARMLVENVGFGADATHTSGGVPDHVRNARPAPMAFPLVHPQRGADTTAIDSIVERRAYGISRAAATRARLARLPLARRVAAALRAVAAR